MSIEKAERLGFEGVRAGTREILNRVLLACGVLYALVYAVANDVVAASAYEGYSRMSQAVSELSAIGAPTKPFLTAMLPAFIALAIAFGIGVWRSADGKRALRVTGALLIAHALMWPLWLLGPMSQREVIAAGQGTSSDTLHIVLTVMTVLLLLSYMAFGAAAFGSRFRFYTLVTALVVIIGGALTGVQSAKMVAGEPTPWLGLVERTGMAAWLVWLMVLAIVLLRGRAHPLRS